MTALVERDEAKRLINAHVAECFRLAGHNGLPVILHPGPVADAILALRQPGAEYRRAYLMTGTWELDPEGKSPGIYTDDPKGGDPICLATLARIYHEDALRRTLSDSIPDTKGGRDG